MKFFIFNLLFTISLISLSQEEKKVNLYNKNTQINSAIEKATIYFNEKGNNIKFGNFYYLSFLKRMYNIEYKTNPQNYLRTLNIEDYIYANLLERLRNDSSILDKDCLINNDFSTNIMTAFALNSDVIKLPPKYFYEIKQDAINEGLSLITNYTYLYFIRKNGLEHLSKEEIIEFNNLDLQLASQCVDKLINTNVLSISKVGAYLVLMLNDKQKLLKDSNSIIDEILKKQLLNGSWFFEDDNKYNIKKSPLVKENITDITTLICIWFLSVSKN